MKRLYIILFLGLTAMTTTRAQTVKVDAEAAAIVTANTGSAEGLELLNKAQADSVNMDKIVTLSDATIRYTMKMAEKAEREKTVFNRDSKAYIELVRQCSLFGKDMSKLMELAVKHPTKMAMCVANGADLLEQAYGVVRHAIVVGMNNKVPLPWKVDLKKLLSGKDKTPDYGSDSSRDKKKEDDGENLLLPDERYRIVNNAIYRLKDMRRSIHVISVKLAVSYSFREKMKNAMPFSKTTFAQWSNAFKNLDNPFSGCPGL